jgi:FkbM family methyltransferase
MAEAATQHNGTEAITVESQAATITASRHTLAANQETDFEIFIDSNEKDEISTAIANQTFVVPVTFSLLPRFARSGATVLDLGAHIGTFSLYAASLGYDVLAVEASPYNAALLRHSADRNGFSNLRVAPVAVSDHAGTLEFIAAGPYGLVANPFLNSPTVSVPADTVDHLLNDVGWDTVDFIKMDIEGSELRALRGMTGLLGGVDAPPILFESNGFTLGLLGTDPSHLLAFLEAFGYRCYLVQPGRLIPTGFRELQPELCVDYITTKNPLPTLQDWPISPPMSPEERVTRILSSCVHRDRFARAYIARALAAADSAILANPRIVRALEILTGDEDKDVRAAATETLGLVGDLGNSTDAVDHALVRKDAEIARLRKLLQDYEHGRFIRTMRLLHGWWQRIKAFMGR